MYDVIPVRGFAYIWRSWWRLSVVFIATAQIGFPIQRCRLSFWRTAVCFGAPYLGITVL